MQDIPPPRGATQALLRDQHERGGGEGRRSIYKGPQFSGVKLGGLRVGREPPTSTSEKKSVSGLYIKIAAIHGLGAVGKAAGEPVMLDRLGVVFVMILGACAALACIALWALAIEWLDKKRRYSETHMGGIAATVALWLLIPPAVVLFIGGIGFIIWNGPGPNCITPRCMGD